jgi:hypothetical protein
MTFAAFFVEPTKSWQACFPSKKSSRLKDPQRNVERSRYISVKDSHLFFSFLGGFQGRSCVHSMKWM